MSVKNLPLLYARAASGAKDVTNFVVSLSEYGAPLPQPSSITHEGNAFMFHVYLLLTFDHHHRQASTTSTTLMWAVRMRPSSRVTGRSPLPRIPSGAHPSPKRVDGLVELTLNPVDDGSGKLEHYVGCGMRGKLDGDGIMKYGRLPVKLVIVLDISGSMASSFSRRKEYLSFAGKRIAELTPVCM